MTHSYTRIYLAPHYDDASLSCGGAIHRLTQMGQAALVVTVCAAPPPADEPLSPFAEQLHRAWGSPADVIATRQAEDRASLEILGADYLRLNFNDCIYRGHPEQGQWFYNDDAGLFGPIHLDDLPLIPKIVEALQELLPIEPDTAIYAPLGVGHHVDHQLVHTAAWQLHRQGWRVAFYEDYPYADPASRYAAAGWGHTLENTLAALATTPLQPRLDFFAEENLQAKIKSVRAYASQMPTLFEREADLEQQLRAYARHIGAGQLAERVWIPR